MCYGYEQVIIIIIFYDLKPPSKGGWTDTVRECTEGLFASGSSSEEESSELFLGAGGGLGFEDGVRESVPRLGVSGAESTADPPLILALGRGRLEARRGE